MLLKNTTMDITIAGFKFPHHSESSGYHQLVNYIDCSYINANEMLLGGKSNSKLTKFNYLLFELNLFIKLRLHKPKIIHYLYPEQHLLLSNPKSSKNISVATIHLDESWLEVGGDIGNRKFISLRRRTYSNLDGIITLSTVQKDRLKKIFPNKNIAFIPHGINEKEKELVNAAKLKKNSFIITIVGSNYRDEDQFFRIADVALMEHPNWKFNLIGVSNEWKVRAEKYRNIIVHPFLEEEEYFKVLLNSHIHLLPLKFATANNALLEAHSLGVPSVVTNYQGVSDYSLPTTFKFNNDEEAINILRNINSMEESNYIRLRKETLEKAEKFYWKNIAKQIKSFYTELLVEKLDKK